MSGETIEEWAARVAPGLDAEGWAGVRAMINSHDEGASETEFGGRSLSGDDSPDVAKARALLAYRRRSLLADGTP